MLKNQNKKQRKTISKSLMADFETTTDESDCRVWAYALYDYHQDKMIKIDNNIDSFMSYLENNVRQYNKIYFHNEKFDGNFILSWLFNHGWTHNTPELILADEKQPRKQPKTFDTLISDTGQFFSLTLYWKVYEKGYVKTTIVDSLKKIPLKVSEISRAFGIEELKGSIDYHMKRKVGHKITDEEKAYIINDVKIVGKALLSLEMQGMSKLTIGSDALSNYKGMFPQFRNLFPVLSMKLDTFFRMSYRGGFTYLVEEKRNKEFKGVVLDVNSLYPYVMYYRQLPKGVPIYFKGEYQENKEYPLYIIRFDCSFKLKKGYLPTIQMKNNPNYKYTEYVKSTNDEITEMFMTNVDFELFKKHYDIDYIDFKDGYMFMSSDLMFREYIDYWIEVKKNNEGGIRQLAKLMLNSLYGKFGTNPISRTKSPYLADDGVVRFHLDKYGRDRQPVYTALATFVTAYAREYTISHAQSCKDRFIYADTDSLHLIGYELPDINIDDKELGYWSIEYYFARGKFLKPKTYFEEDRDNSGVNHVCGAGMSHACHKYATFENFKYGTKYPENLKSKSVVGGIVLVDDMFTLRA